MRAKLVTALFTATLVSCASTNVQQTLTSHGVEMPSVTIKDVDIKGISLRDIDLLFNVEIANPYPVAIKLEKVTFQVDVEQKQLFSVTTPSGFTIEAKGSAATPLVLNIEYTKIIDIVEDFTQKDALLCDISGELSIPLPKLPGLPPTYTHPFKVSKKIPAIKPSVSVDNFRVKAPTMAEIQEMIKISAKKNLKPKAVLGAIGDLLSGESVDPAKVGLEDLDLTLQVSFDIRLKNDARAKISFDTLGYDFSMNGEQVFTGDSSKTQTVGDELIIRVLNKLSSKKLGKGVLEVFKQRRGDFRVRGKASLSLPAEIATAPVELSFDEAGGFSL